MRWRLVVGSAALSMISVLSLPGVAAAAGLALGNYTPVIAGTPTFPQRLEITTSTIYWSALAIRPPAGANYNLRLHPDRHSNAGAGLIDFVAINSDHCQPFATFDATVTQASGQGSYHIEFAQGRDILKADGLPFPGTNPLIASIFGPGIGGGPTHFVGVRDIYLEAGRRVEVYAAHVGGVPGEVFVMASNPAEPWTCIRTRNEALAAGRYNLNGQHGVVLRFTPTRTGWYGLVQVSYGPNPQIGYSTLRVGMAPPNA